MWHHHNYEASARMRDRYIPLEKVMEVLEPGERDTIMDIGGGDGHYSVEFSRHCRKVIYVDPSVSAVGLIGRKLPETGGNIVIVQEDACSMNIPDDVTKVFFSNSFHDIPCREDIVERFSRERGEAQFILIEFKKDSDIGPPRDIKIDPDELDEIFLKRGYRPIRREFLEKHYITRYSR